MRRALAHTGGALLLFVSSSCASGTEGAAPGDSDPDGDAQVDFAPLDASEEPTSLSADAGSTPLPPTDDSSNPRSASGGGRSTSSDGGSRTDTSRDASPSSSSSDGIDDLISGLFGGSDAGTNANSGDGATSGDWKLEADSAPECPPEPPPIPIIGGDCLGIYYTCNWKNSAGQTYFCTCDWVHWLCI